MFAIGMVYAVVLIVSLLAIPLGVGCITSIPLIIGALFITPLSLWLLDKYMPGVEVNGFWTYVVITLVLSMFRVQLKAEQEKS
ncbi:hypothetical protein D3C87_574360 [compost metagenome]